MECCYVMFRAKRGFSRLFPQDKQSLLMKDVNVILPTGKKSAHFFFNLIYRFSLKDLVY